jgi:purine-binding chemotaxis protein CheW
MVVDAVSEVLRLPEEQIEPAPAFVGGIEAEHIYGVGKTEGRLVILLNMDNILSIDTGLLRAV